MDYRSSNTIGFTHFGGAIVAGVEGGSGVELSPQSSGSAAVITVVGDETNKSLSIVGKGTGTVTLGNSSSPVALAGAVTQTGGATFGSSGTALTEVRAFTVQFTPPALSSGLVSGAESTYTVTGVSTGTVLMFTPTNPISALYTVRARCSTANELTLAWGNIGDSTLGSGESTNRGTVLQFRF